MNRNQVKKAKKNKKREKRVSQRKDKALKTVITKDDRKFGKLQIITLFIFVLAFLGFIISKIK
ncbi:MAG: hypothetical protein ACO20H_05655 [Bacteriovoracaceae bacterium]